MDALITDAGDLTRTENGQRKLLTAEQVAEYLQVKVPRVYELVKSRRVSAVRVGRQLRFRPSDVEHFLERNLTGRW